MYSVLSWDWTRSTAEAEWTNSNSVTEPQGSVIIKSLNSVNKGTQMAKVVTSKMLMALQSEVTSKTLEVEAVKKDLSNETNEEILTRLRDRFEILDDMTRAVKSG